MTRDRLFLFDTTLRDGQQTQGVQFSAAEKHQIAAMVKTLLPGAKMSAADESDALAIAICHAHHRTTQMKLRAAS